MTIREAQKEQRKSIKNRSPKEQLSYYWEYYGLKAICLILALILLIVFIVSIATKKEYAVTAVFFGGIAQEGSEEYLSAFGQAAGIDPKKYDISVQCHPGVQKDQPVTQEVYQAMEVFSTMVASQSVDCFAGDDTLFLHYAYLGYCSDLRTILTQEELTQLSPHLHYIDGELLRQLENDDTAPPQYPDSTKPELMTDPIPVAVSFEAATDAFKEAYVFGENTVIGICVTSEQPENASAFLRYCLNNK